MFSHPKGVFFNEEVAAFLEAHQDKLAELLVETKGKDESEQERIQRIIRLCKEKPETS